MFVQREPFDFQEMRDCVISTEAIIYFIDIHLESVVQVYYPQNIIDKPVRVEGNKSETRRFHFELVYPLCFVEYILNVNEYIYTVCPGSSDPPEKNIKYICIRK